MQMQFNINKRRRRIYASVFFTVIFSAFVVLPIFTQRAQAQWTVFDPAIFGVISVDTTRTTVRDVIDAAARIAAQIVLDRVVKSTVSWAQSGFEGNPVYATDPKKFFVNIADEEAGKFIEGTDLGFLCSPFQSQIRLSLKESYAQPEQFQCTLTDVVENIEDFYQDFNKGGWDAWFSMTQNSSNNPYGAYLDAKIELDSRVANAIGLKEKELNWNQGFLSMIECKTFNPPATIEVEGWGTVPNSAHVSGKAVGECIEPGKVKTPGVTIKAQLDKVLPTGVEKLVRVEHVEQLVEAFAVGVIKRYVFGPKGLFDKSSNDWTEEGGPVTPPGGRFVQIDIDGDGIFDGMDTDGDGEPNSCYFGGANTPLGPPCLGSEEAIVLPPGGGGPSCTSTATGKHEGALRSAMDAVLSENPDVAALPNTDANDRQNARTFLALVVSELVSMGYNATDEVLNGNGRPNTGDLIAVWRQGEPMMERYDAIIGDDPNTTTRTDTIGGATTADLVGTIPLNCTAGGGGNDCADKCDTGGGGTEQPPTVPPTNPTPGNAFIQSVSPTSAKPGVTTIIITGMDLTNQVSFFDGAGNRETVAGSVNSAKTQTTVRVPASLPIGNATVKIYQGNQVWSNGKLIQITDNAPSNNITLATPTSTLTPTGIDRVGYLDRIYPNGWYPTLSPNGRYVAFGNWGDSFVLDLESGNTTPQWNFAKPEGLPEGVRCMAGQWLSNTKLTFICEITTNSMWRYEVTVGEWIARKTSDNPSYVLSSMFRAKDNHWVTYAAPNDRNGVPAQIVKDNQVIAPGAGGAISIAGNTVVHACNNNNSSICVRTGSTLSRSYTTSTGFHSTATDGSYILYGGYEAGVKGITPTGSIINLTLSPSGYEGPSEIIMVNGVRWVITTAWGDNYTYIILRPWGSRSAIVVDAPATWTSTVYKDGNFVIAYNNDVGAMKVIIVPANAPRYQF